MGPDSRTDGGGGSALTRIAQVVPNLATFAVDDGFSYRIPDGVDGVAVGSLVRVPLGGRRVRGFVTHLREGVAPDKLRDVAGVVGDFPLFTPRLLETLRWTAVHYVAPLAAVLAKSGPPNVARRVRAVTGELRAPASPLPAVTGAAAENLHLRTQYLVGAGPWAEPVAGLVGGVLAAGRNAMVIAATVAEAHALAAAIQSTLAIPVHVATSAEPAKEVTMAWAAGVGGAGVLAVGTRELAFWPMGDLGMVVVVEEGRAAMKAPQTPTTNVRDVMRRRAATERFGLVVCGPVPTIEMIAAGAEVHEPSQRVWPLVEIVDRSEEPPGGSVVMAATVRAIRGTLRAGGGVFVFVPRRGDAAAYRCVSCGELRRCPNCGAAASRGDVCARCETRLERCAECAGERFEALGAGLGRVKSELRRSLGVVVGGVEEETAVVVGTERDLPGVGQKALAVVIDADGMVFAPHYRAEEDAFRTIVRVASLVGRGRGRRCLIQTANPRHRVYDALRHGRPGPLLHELLKEREEAGFPPVSQLLAVELTDARQGADAELRALGAGVSVHGPAVSGDVTRWLVSGPDLRPLKLQLRGQVQRWRDGGAKVRIDADPVRL